MPEKVYKIIKKIGEGAFGEIFQAINTKTNLEVAVKIEPVDTLHPQLIQQCKLYNYLHDDSTVIDKGSFSGITLQSNSQEILPEDLMLIDQMISRIEYIHNKNIIHRDINPDNFCIGLNKISHKIFIIDFGHAKRRINFERNGCLWGSLPPLTKNVIYASINAYLQNQQSYKNDMESIGYIAMYFMRGMLPWQGLKANSIREKHELIKKIKLQTSFEALCKGYPVEFSKYLNQCRNMWSRPQYSAMKSMFKDLFQRLGQKFDYQYDWVIQAEKEKMEKKELFVNEDAKQV